MKTRAERWATMLLLVAILAQVTPEKVTDSQLVVFLLAMIAGVVASWVIVWGWVRS